MSDPVIHVEGVSKRYQIGTLKTNLITERVGMALRSPFRRPPSETFWALRDVDIDVQQGEVVGVLGRNGAGKSTLLKILTQVTAPTEGRVTVRGRMGALLEVGTGFHPELTGRENVFLNGTILGMSRQEIAAKFDEIVEFSGVERFLETPVKRYSSGMVVRLGFSVAAHLEPEILVIDEVLAVGDAEFQRKCLAKVSDIARSGRTILFVSHNLAAVKRICDRAYLLDGGRVVREGPSAEVIEAYLSAGISSDRSGEITIGDDFDRNGNGDALLRRLQLVDPGGAVGDRLKLGEPFRIRMTWEVVRPIEVGIIEIGVTTGEGARTLTVQSTDAGGDLLTLEPGMHQIDADIDVGLLPGEYRLDAGMRLFGTQHNADFVWDALGFTVSEVNSDTGELWHWVDTRGHVRPPVRWSYSEGAVSSERGT